MRNHQDWPTAGHGSMRSLDNVRSVYLLAFALWLGTEEVIFSRGSLRGTSAF
jgi:hypothetical protein